MLRMRLQPPCAYQGGKRRQAPEIVRHMGVHASRDVPFTELCCGGAAVSLELISRGKPPELVTLVDAGPWGLFWKNISEGYDVGWLRAIAKEVPTSVASVAEWACERAGSFSSSAEVPYLFLFLQSASFGGKPIGWQAGRWSHDGFRKPTAISPWVWSPEPAEIVRRVEALSLSLKGVRAHHADSSTFAVQGTGTVYMDPPYAGTSGYAHSFDAVRLAGRLAHFPCYVSERVPLNPSARMVRPRRKTGVCNGAKVDAAEYLTLFNAEWTTPEPVVERVEQTSLF